MFSKPAQQGGTDTEQSFGGRSPQEQGGSRMVNLGALRVG